MLHLLVPVFVTIGKFFVHFVKLLLVFKLLFVVLTVLLFLSHGKTEL